jgi:hypothetical protein
LCAAGYWLAADCWKICILFGKLDRIGVSGGLTKFGAYAIHDWLWVQRRFSAQSTERRDDFAIPQKRE